jgi:hypothetical protein
LPRLIDETPPRINETPRLIDETPPRINETPRFINDLPPRINEKFPREGGAARPHPARMPAQAE